MKKPHVLLCSGWQTVNIGDIAHTPGALSALEEFLPDTDVTVWAFNPLTPATLDLMKRRFPRVAVVSGKVGDDGSVSDPDTLAALDRADFLLHGSGPATLAWRHAEAFTKRTGRPFGVYGVTYGLYGIPEKATLSRARFVYFRDSVSLEAARRDDVRPPVMGLAPDVAFAFRERNDAAADAYLKSVGLEPGRFVCCLSRLRNTPFWEIPAKKTPLDPVKHARNEEKREADHRPLIEAVTAVARETRLRVLVCPEDETQIRITRENLVERLPADVRARVVWRDRFWTPDEALGVYVRSAGLFGAEMHSPIMCIGSGIPAIVCRWAEQSTKGLMWRDLGMGDWLFDLDRPEESARVAPTVLALARDPDAAKAKAAAANALVRRRYAETMAVVAREIRAAMAGRVSG